MKGKALRKHSLHEKTAASVLRHETKCLIKFVVLALTVTLNVAAVMDGIGLVRSPADWLIAVSLASALIKGGSL